MCVVTKSYANSVSYIHEDIKQIYLTHRHFKIHVNQPAFDATDDPTDDDLDPTPPPTAVASPLPIPPPTLVDAPTLVDGRPNGGDEGTLLLI